MAKARTRVDEICRDAEAGARAMSESDPLTIVPMKTAFYALSRRVDAIVEKLENTWDEQDLDELGPDVIPALGDWNMSKRYIEETWAACKIRAACAALRVMWPYVDVATTKPIACTRCGAAIEPSTRRTSETVTCRNCQAANQCIPEPVTYAWFEDAPFHFAMEQLLQPYFEVLRARADVEIWAELTYRQTDDRPDEPEEARRARHARARAFATAFVATKARISGASPAEQAIDVDRTINQLALF